MAGTQELTNGVGCLCETTYKKLRKLEDAGSVDSQKVANARVWLFAERTETER